MANYALFVQSTLRELNNNLKVLGGSSRISGNIKINQTENKEGIAEKRDTKTKEQQFNNCQTFTIIAIKHEIYLTF